MQFYLTALILALSMGCMGWGIYISMKISGLPDITTDGSYTLGAAVTAACLQAGMHWIAAFLLSMLAGMLAGTVTGIIHTRLKVQALLSGILVMTALYSINLLVMGRSNIPLDEEQTIFSSLMFSSDTYFPQFIVVALLCLTAGTALFWFLRTDTGIALRATGNAPLMARSMGVNTGVYQVSGLALANTFTAISGGLVAQVQLFADINMGIGIVIFGLGAVMIGESITGRRGATPGWQILGVLAGCIIFRFIIALTLQTGADPVWLRLITSLVVLAFVASPAIRRRNNI
jgi:putative tryptophan/tyrosine transport system permease protein